MQHTRLLKIALLTSTISLACLNLSGCGDSILLAGASAAAAIGISATASSLSLSTQMDDANIKLEAVNIINNTPALKGDSNVEITVFNRVVLILGQVPNTDLSGAIANKIAQIHGVRIVYNELTIGKPVSLDQYLDDGWITSKIKAGMIGKVHSAHFDVVTEQGVVYLLGVTTPQEGATAAEIAAGTQGVKRVVKAFYYLNQNSGASAANTDDTTHQNVDDSTQNQN